MDRPIIIDNESICICPLCGNNLKIIIKSEDNLLLNTDGDPLISDCFEQIAIVCTKCNTEWTEYMYQDRTTLSYKFKKLKNINGVKYKQYNPFGKVGSIDVY